MRKFLVIFFSLFYLVMASGFTQYTHWCKESAITVSSLKNTKQQDKPCPICSNKEKGLKDQKKNCCQYDTKIVKVDDSVKKQNSFDFSVKFLEFTLSNKTLGTVYDAEILALVNVRCQNKRDTSF